MLLITKILHRKNPEGSGSFIVGCMDQIGFEPTTFAEKYFPYAV